MFKTSVDWHNIWLRYINRSMLALSLFGVLDTVHLYVQNQYGFNKGCLGFIDTAIENSFNCQQVVSSEAGKLLGISNTFIGLAFFSLFSIFLFLRIYNFSRAHEKINQYGGYVLTPALLYVCYLLYYQYAILEEYCLLCLISASIITLLFVLEGCRLMLSRKRFSFFLAPVPPTIKTEFSYRTAFVLIVALVSAADVMLADYQQAETAATTTANQSIYQADSLLLSDIKEIKMPLKDSDGCRFSQNQRDSSFNLVSFYDPVIGSASPSHSVVVYFNPVNPNSLEAFKIVRKFLDQVRPSIEVVLKPVAPTPIALEAVRLLYLANEQDAAISLLENIINLSTSDAEINKGQQSLQKAAESAGLDYRQLRDQMDNPQLNGWIYMEKEKALAADVDILPAIFIEGRKVAAENMSLKCLSKLIDDSAPPDE